VHNLTDISIRALKPPAKGHIVLWDKSITGFGVRCSQGGTKSFFLMYGTARARYQIGRVGIITLAEARELARKFLAQRTLGKRDNPTLNFEDGIAVFLESQSERIRPSTMRDYKRILDTHFKPKLKGKSLTELQTHHLTAIIDKLLPTKAECNYAFAVARRFFRWAVSRRYLAHSPLEGIGLPTKTETRERVLSAAEIVEVWRKALDTHFGRILKLCIITAQRRGELGAIREEWINKTDRTITFPASITKNRRPHTFPYPPIADPLLEGTGLLFPARGKDTPFNGWSKSKLALDKKLENVAPFTIHDLRRTTATQIAQFTPPHIVERLLNHTQQGTAPIYNRHAYIEEMRVAMNEWQTRLDQILKQV
jgi:integrase